MLRFDSELELESHDLGRSLLAMVRDANEEFQGLPRLDSPIPSTNPFEAVRERLEATQLAIHDLRVEVQLLPWLSSLFDLLGGASHQSQRSLPHFNLWKHIQYGSNVFAEHSSMHM
jgi:hypothetical protein